MLKRVVAVLLVVALAGCSSKGDDDGATTTAPTTAAPTGSATSSTGSPSSNPPPPPPPQTHDIAMQGNRFVDGSITIRVGDTVHWTDMDLNTIHNVVSQSSAARFNSGDMHPLIPIMESEFSFKFDKAGAVEYTCTYHPGTMTETITVV